jgi:hypothetical protein
MPTQRSRSSVYNLYMNHYHAQLVADMGLTPPDSSLRKLMVPLTAADYEAVFFRLPRPVSSMEAGKIQNRASPTSDTVLGQLSKGGAASGSPVAASRPPPAGTNSNTALGKGVKALVSLKMGK